MNDQYVPNPDYEDPKEIYAFFGLAFYKANVLEHGVLNLAVAMLARDEPGITVAQVNKLYDSFDKHTFGQILNIAAKRFQFSEEFSERLQEGVAKRNYLAHRFFIEHDTDLLTEHGRKSMIDELLEVIALLIDVDREMDAIWKSAWKPFGITQEWIDEQMDKYVEHMKKENA